jgi:hypothetical protein
MPFSSPRRIYQDLMSIPIATELMKKHTTFTATFSLIISARTPLIIRVIHPAARAYTASVKMLFVASATTDEIIKNINDAKDTIDILFIKIPQKCQQLLSKNRVL